MVEVDPRLAELTWIEAPGPYRYKNRHPLPELRRMAEQPYEPYNGAAPEQEDGYAKRPDLLADIERRNAGKPVLVIFGDKHWNIVGEMDLAYETDVFMSISLGEVQVNQPIIVPDTRDDLLHEDGDLRESIAEVLEKVADEKLEHPRDVDVALDAILTGIEARYICRRRP